MARFKNNVLLMIVLCEEMVYLDSRNSVRVVVRSWVLAALDSWRSQSIWMMYVSSLDDEFLLVIFVCLHMAFGQSVEALGPSIEALGPPL